MDKKQALKDMAYHARNVVSEEFVNEMLQPFGLTTSDLALKPTKVNKFSRLNYHPDDAEKLAIPVSTLARRLCKKLTGVEVESNMYGTGSHAAHITKQAIAEIEKTL